MAMQNAARKAELETLRSRFDRCRMNVLQTEEVGCFLSRVARIFDTATTRNFRHCHHDAATT